MLPVATIKTGNGFSKTLQDEVKKAFDDQYGNNPDHPGQFLSENGEWLDLPVFTNLFDKTKGA